MDERSKKTEKWELTFRPSTEKRLLTGLRSSMGSIDMPIIINDFIVNYHRLRDLNLDIYIYIYLMVVGEMLLQNPILFTAETFNSVTLTSLFNLDRNTKVKAILKSRPPDLFYPYK